MASQDLTLREVFLADMYEGQIVRKDAQIQKLERTIAEHLENIYLIDIVVQIREKSGVGVKPMLTDLPESIGARIRELEEALEPFAKEGRHRLADCASRGVKTKDEWLPTLQIPFGHLRRAHEVYNRRKANE